MQEMGLLDALRSIMSLFMETIKGYGTENAGTIKSKVPIGLPAIADILRDCSKIYDGKVKL